MKWLDNKIYKHSIMLILATLSNLWAGKTDPLLAKGKEELENVQRKGVPYKKLWNWIKDHKAGSVSMLSALGAIVIGGIGLAKRTNSNVVIKKPVVEEKPLASTSSDLVIGKNENLSKIPADALGLVLQYLSPKDIGSLLRSSKQMVDKSAYFIITAPKNINGLSPNIALKFLEMGILTPEQLKNGCNANPKLLAKSSTVLSVLRGHRIVLKESLVAGRAPLIYGVKGVEWSPNSKQIASCGEDRTIRIWNPANGRQKYLLRDYKRWFFNTQLPPSVHLIKWSPDSKRITYPLSNYAIGIFDTTTGKDQCVLRGHRQNICDLAWSQNGTQLASYSFHDRLCIWDTTTGRQIASIIIGRNGIEPFSKSIAWSPNGIYLAFYTKDHKIRIVNTTTGLEKYLPGENISPIVGIAWSPDGVMLASYSLYDDKIHIWDTTTGKQPTIIVAYKKRSFPNSIKWSQNGINIFAVPQEPKFTYGGHKRSPDDRQIAIFSSLEPNITIKDISSLNIILSKYQAKKPRRGLRSLIEKLWGNLT